MRGVDIGHAVERVEARRGIVVVSRLRRVLPVQRPLRWNDAREHLRIAFRPLNCVVGRQLHIQRVAGPPQQLCTRADIVDVVEDKKAEDIVLLDLRPDVVMADFFVICNGNSDRQLKALIDNVREAVKEKYGKLPFGVEGTADSGWVLMDYSDVVVHIFLEEKRQYYDLESLWSAEASVLLSIQ